MKYLLNEGEFFTSNYFDLDFDQRVMQQAGVDHDIRAGYIKKLSGLRQRYYSFKDQWLKTRRTEDQIRLSHTFHCDLLRQLGYTLPDEPYLAAFPLNDKECIPVLHRFYHQDQPYLFLMEMQAMIRPAESENPPQGIFEQSYKMTEWKQVFRFRENGVKVKPAAINEALSELLLLPQAERPAYVLLLAGPELYLIHASKWHQGAYLRFHLEDLFAEARLEANRPLALLYVLLGHEFLVGKTDSLLSALDEESHKKAFEVTKDLKTGVIRAVELLANEAIWYGQQHGDGFSPDTDPDLARRLKDDALRLVYRLLFLFYAESRRELRLLPVDDPIYQRGYSLERLRDLELVNLASDAARNGYFFDDSLQKLFSLLANGYESTVDDPQKDKKTFVVRPLDSPLFEARPETPGQEARPALLNGARMRNFVWQEIIRELSLTQPQRNQKRGRISYENLGLNQLGSVYESLLAYRGIFATEELIEVHPKDQPEEGTFLTPRHRRDLFSEGEVLRDPNDPERDLIHPRGSFVYRLSGRDRQKSASYYTPEVLTRTTVKYTLKPILERLQQRLEQGEAVADEILQFAILEPAMGAAAFQNEVIDQLADAYLEFKQKEVVAGGGNRIAPGEYQTEKQKVKCYLAIHGVYGVDLNPTAIELGKLSLWLNVIHAGMETPFFGYQLGHGNAVIGCWLKTYTREQVVASKLHRLDGGKWWEKAPEYRPWGAKRPENEVYHFLLPDKGMLAAADHKWILEQAEAAKEAELRPKYGPGLDEKELQREVKKENAVARAKAWRTEFTQPLSLTEWKRVQRISARLDELLSVHLSFQEGLKQHTANRLHLYGQAADPAARAAASTYREREKLMQQRDLNSTPYFRIKQVMDYWCALWFWDPAHYAELPTRQQWYDELEGIVGAEAEQAASRPDPGLGALQTGAVQASLFGGAQQLRLGDAAPPVYRPETATAMAYEEITRYRARNTLFETSPRAAYVARLWERHRFFHYPLEFVEVFARRGGFDVIVGNPPWVNIEFNEAGLVGEVRPELLIRKYSAPEIRKEVEKTLAEHPALVVSNRQEVLDVEGGQAFLSSAQNFPLVAAFRSNIYKCILENSLRLTAPQGYAGLLHPEGIYDDPKGYALRKFIYPRLRYHFRFQNEKKLFQIGNRETFSTNIYGGSKENVEILAIFNLFHPVTIEDSFHHDGSGLPGGIKIKMGDDYSWNILPHRDRIVMITENELRILARTFENSPDWEGAKLVSIHARQIISVLKKLSEFPRKVEQVEFFTSDGWNETTAVDKGIIRRETKYPDLAQHELIYSGPHFFVGNPIYQTPKKVCETHKAYDSIDLTRIPADYVPRTNYVPAEDLRTFRERIKGLDPQALWIDQYRLFFSEMVSLAGERTLKSTLVPPKVTNVNTVISILFKEEKHLIELSGLTNSVPFDFFIKTKAKGHVNLDTIGRFPIGIAPKFYAPLALRTLLLNCLTQAYAPLWARHYEASWRGQRWASNDARLPDLGQLGPEWSWHTPLRSAYARRWALVELDVIAAKALGLSLEELILLYEVQFPVLQQNEDDTWYDQQGRIVFTCSKGLTGVGLDRKEWELVRDMGPADTPALTGIPDLRCPAPGQLTQTIRKSELYAGQEVTYHAPFTRCDRVADYGRVWDQIIV